MKYLRTSENDISQEISFSQKSTRPHESSRMNFLHATQAKLMEFDSFELNGRSFHQKRQRGIYVNSNIIHHHLRIVSSRGAFLYCVPEKGWRSTNGNGIHLLTEWHETCGPLLKTRFFTFVLAFGSSHFTVHSHKNIHAMEYQHSTLKLN